MNKGTVTIIGGGPAGLTAAVELTRRGAAPLVFEQSEHLGGISRTEVYEGFRFDIGGHRFYTKVPRVMDFWQSVLNEEFLERPRLSRIFYRGKFFDYPLRLDNTLSNLGALESLRIMGSYAWTKLRPVEPEDNLENWVTNRFGKKLYETFFKTYTEKVWGIPCTEIRADWAAQRIKDLSLKKAIWDALGGARRTSTPTSLIKQFHYPRLGPGMMWDECGRLISTHGGHIELQTSVEAIHHQEGVATRIVLQREGQRFEQPVDYVINSMPINLLIRALRPAPPQAVLEAARALKYRDFMVIALIIEQEDIFPDNWVYVHEPEVQLGRIQNYKNWSPDMCPDPKMTCLGLEYFCNEGDAIWTMDKDALLEFAAAELEQIGVAPRSLVRDGHVIWQKKAYPVYDADYRANLQILEDYLRTFKNLVTVGRAGMHRYNNQDHSMLTAMFAVDNYFGANHDLWNVNVDRAYHEEFVNKPNGLPAEANPSPTAWSRTPFRSK